MSGPDPAVAAVRTAVRRSLVALTVDADLVDGAVGDNGLVLVACSGGADSLALAAATAFVAPRLPVPLRAGAVVVDHGWRPDSADVAEAAAQACRALGLDPVEAVPVIPTDGDGGPEARARDGRYSALHAAAERHGALAVLLGHTQDDQAESVLLGLARGSGARSLAGMAARRGRYLRPLLDLPRSTTRQACAALGLTPWEDPSNVDPAYARARVRAALVTLEDALGPGFAPALARTADLLREDADALEALAGDLVGAARLVPSSGPHVSEEPPLLLDLDVLATAPAAVRRRALLQALRAAGCPAGSLGRRHVLAVDALVVEWHGQGPAHLPGGVVARRDCGRLALVPAGRDHGIDDAHADDAQE